MGADRAERGRRRAARLCRRARQGHRRSAAAGVVARGLGRAYGDAAQNAGGRVVDATGVAGILDLDVPSGVVRVAGGTSLDELLRVLVPQGLFVPVTPGTRFVTVGGAIASDIHGKNHHADGTFGAHVQSLVLALPDGTTRTLTPAGSPAEFWATCGGMGLTGTIVEATVACKHIETSLLAVDTDRVADLDDLLDRLREGQQRYRYSVAWVDLLAPGRHLGRSVLTQGDFAPLAALAPGDRRLRDPLRFAPRAPVPAPHAPSGLLNRLTIGAFNEFWFRKAPARRRDELQSITTFFHPLDMADGWNRLYGGRGFLQWQCLLPFGEEAVLRRCIEALSDFRAPSFFAVLKTFGAADPGPLSFPAPGWTLALDVPAGSPELAAPARPARPRRRGGRRPAVPRQGQQGAARPGAGHVPATRRVARRPRPPRPRPAAHERPGPPPPPHRLTRSITCRFVGLKDRMKRLASTTEQENLVRLQDRFCDLGISPIDTAVPRTASASAARSKPSRSCRGPGAPGSKSPWATATPRPSPSSPVASGSGVSIPGAESCSKASPARSTAACS